jgi:DNA-binding beta-propeller fold protein YncE
MQVRGAFLAAPMRALRKYWSVGFLASILLPLSVCVHSERVLADDDDLLARSEQDPARGTVHSGGLLIDGRLLMPQGRETEVGTLPMNGVLLPGMRRMAVINCGALQQSIQIVDVNDGKVIQTIAIALPGNLYLGAAVSTASHKLFVAGGGTNTLNVFTLGADDTVDNHAVMSLGDQPNAFILGVDQTPQGLILVTDEGTGRIVIVDPATEGIVREFQIAGHPYEAQCLDRLCHTLIVSDWRGGYVRIVNVDTGTVTKELRVGGSPTSIVVDALSGNVFVSDSAGSELLVLSADLSSESRIRLRPSRLKRDVSGPTAIVQDTRHGFLYVALAHENLVAVLRQNPRLAIAGYLRTSWYPVGLTLSPETDSLFVISAKGRGAGPNSNGEYPDPTRKKGQFINGYQNAQPNADIQTMIHGTLARIDVSAVSFSHGTVLAVRKGIHTEEKWSTIRRRLRYVFLVIRENRTYDQVFGDVAQGDGEPRLAIFGQKLTPNAHALAKRFGLYDRFFCNGEVSDDGHAWTTGAIASDYVVRTNGQMNRPYDVNGSVEVSNNPFGALWDEAARHGITYRVYGERAREMPPNAPVRILSSSDQAACTGPETSTYAPLPTFPFDVAAAVSLQPGERLCFPPEQPVSGMPSLLGHLSPRYRGWDLRFPDRQRIKAWKSDFEERLALNAVPQLQVLWLPSDHTSGTRPGTFTPESMIAENDAALGQLVDAVSHSSIWSQSAIFVVEDDASNGADHVEAHRAPMLLISPHAVHPDGVLHRRYDTVSVLRTIEGLLGLQPLSQFDGLATSMRQSFTPDADDSPYDAVQPSFPLYQVNSDQLKDPRGANLDFSGPDRADMSVLTEILEARARGDE